MNQPLSIINAFNYACRAMGPNETVTRLDPNIKDQFTIFAAIKNLGQKQLVPLTHRYIDSKIALAFYAGNGYVVKVIPRDHLGEGDVVLHLPAISSLEVSTENSRTFVIKTYPWLDGDRISRSDVETMRGNIGEFGLRFTDGDDTPRNLARLPDKNRTLVGIDSNMFEHLSGKDIPQHVIDAWHNYIRNMFPVYDEGRIPEQSGSTRFDFFSAAVPHAKTMEFRLKEQERKAEPIEPQAKGGWLSGLIPFRR